MKDLAPHVHMDVLEKGELRKDVAYPIYATELEHHHEPES